MKKVSKSAQIRALYDQGMNNKQITAALGFKKNYVSQITGNHRRLLRAAGKSIEIHESQGRMPYLKQSKDSSVLSRLWQTVLWICTGRVL